MSVVEFKRRDPDEGKPHAHGPCICLGCRHEWHGV